MSFHLVHLLQFLTVERYGHVNRSRRSSLRLRHWVFAPAMATSTFSQSGRLTARAPTEMSSLELIPLKGLYVETFH